MNQHQILQQAIDEAERFSKRAKELQAEPHTNRRLNSAVTRSSMELTHLLSDWRNFTRHQRDK